MFWWKQAQKANCQLFNLLWKAPVKSPLLGMICCLLGFTSILFIMDAFLSIPECSFLPLLFDFLEESCVLNIHGFFTSLGNLTWGFCGASFSWLKLILIPLAGGQKERNVGLPLSEHSTDSCTEVLRATSFAHRQGICLSHFLFLAFLWQPCHMDALRSSYQYQ